MALFKRVDKVTMPGQKRGCVVYLKGLHCSVRPRTVVVPRAARLEARELPGEAHNGVNVGLILRRVERRPLPARRREQPGGPAAAKESSRTNVTLITVHAASSVRRGRGALCVLSSEKRTARINEMRPQLTGFYASSSRRLSARHLQRRLARLGVGPAVSFGRTANSRITHVTQKGRLGHRKLFPPHRVTELQKLEMGYKTPQHKPTCGLVQRRVLDSFGKAPG